MKFVSIFHLGEVCICFLQKYSPKNAVGIKQMNDTDYDLEMAEHFTKVRASVDEM